MLMRICWWVIAALSVLLNLIFLAVLWWCPAKTLGSLRRFLFGFILIDIIYAIVYALVLPTASTSNGSVVIFAAGVVGVENWGRLGILCFCGLLIIVSLLILNCFIYKFIHMCRMNLIAKYHSPKWVFLQFLGSFIVAADWIYVCDNVFEHNDVFVTTFAEIAKKDFGIENITRVGYMGTSTQLIWNNPRHLAMFSQLAAVTIAIFFIMIYCSRSILAFIKSKMVDCENAHELHLQTLHLLVGQCALPIASLLTPILLIVCFTAFSLQTNYATSSLIGFCFSVFPLFNPMVKMSFIKEYKLFILKKLRPKTAPVSHNPELVPKHDGSSDRHF